MPSRLESLVNVLVDWRNMAVIWIYTVWLGNKRIGVIMAWCYCTSLPFNAIHIRRVNGMQVQRVGMVVSYAVY
ncbi:MAG: hypothetical protein WCF07_01420 [Nitrososphaeraceae archaeon]